jgi:hypothetical protein
LEASSQDASTPTPISERLLAYIQNNSFPRTPENPCFPVEDGRVTKCLVTTAEISSSNPPSKEFGILLKESFNSVETWQHFLEQAHISGAELLHGRDAAAQRGGSVAGNLVWLFQSLVNTYSRTIELVKVCLSVLTLTL